MKPLFLPERGLFDSVYMEDGTKPPTMRLWRYWFFCGHRDVRDYVRVDHRAGPGSFADNFGGAVCVECGYIVRETQTL